MIRRTCIFIMLLLAVTILIAQDGYKLRDIRFVGNESISTSELKKQMELKEDDFLYRLQFWKEDRLFDEPALERDTTRILYHYRTEGFLDAKLSLELETLHEKQRVYLTITIDEGEPILIDRITTSYSPADSNRFRTIVQEVKAPLQPGERFRDADLMSRQEKLRTGFEENGYPMAEVEFTLDVSPEQHTTDIRWDIKPDKHCKFGKIRLTGLENDIDEYVLRQTESIDSGEYRQSALKTAQRRIYELGMFKSVTVKSMLSEEENGEIPIEIMMIESPRHNLKVGVGWGIEDRFRVFADYRKLGFLGGVRRLHIYLKHSYLEPVNASLKLVQPDFLNSNGDISISPYFKQQRELSYTINRLGATLGYQKSFTGNIAGYSNVTYEKNDLVEIRLSDEDVFGETADDIYEKTVFTVGSFYDSSAPPLDPEKGVYAGVIYSVAPIREVSDYEFYKIVLDTRAYQRLASWMVLALKLKGGAMEPFGESHATPVEDRFYAGGSYSVRGWQRYQLGPKNDSGYPIGGNSMIEGSIELRYPIYDIFSGVLFLDGGNVWKDSYVYIADQLHFASGVGLRVNTPVGPIRLDFASPVFEKKKELQVHASIGHAF